MTTSQQHLQFVSQKYLTLIKLCFCFPSGRSLIEISENVIIYFWFLVRMSILPLDWLRFWPKTLSVCIISSLDYHTVSCYGRPTVHKICPNFFHLLVLLYDPTRDIRSTFANSHFWEGEISCIFYATPSKNSSRQYLLASSHFFPWYEVTQFCMSDMDILTIAC